MAILTKRIILEEMKKGNIKVVPFLEDQLGPASIDLHLGNTFRRFRHYNRVFSVREDSKVENITNLVQIEDDASLLIKPGETILGLTKEKLSLSPGICAWIEGRSRFARIGLGVHITSGFVQPGSDNYQVLEITNLSPTPLSLYPGTRICQIVFERCEGEAKYQGKFAKQNRP